MPSDVGLSSQLMLKHSHLRGAPVIEVWIVLEPVLLCRIKEHIMQLIVVSWVLHMHGSAHPMDAAHGSCTSSHSVKTTFLCRICMYSCQIA